MYSKRHETILNVISTEREVTVQELSNRLSVSEVTIRKDLTHLEDIGCLIRTRGGARIAEDFRLIRTFAVRRRENIPEKQAIAKQVRLLIRKGDTIFLDSGSTCLEVAKIIKTMELRIVSNSLDILAELSGAPLITLSSPGGSFRKESGAFVGPEAVRSLQQSQFSLCILGATGFSRGGIFSSQNTLETEMKRQALLNSKKRVVAADSSKFDVRAFSIFAQPGDIDILITDDRRTADCSDLENVGIEVIIAQTERNTYE